MNITTANKTNKQTKINKKSYNLKSDNNNYNEFTFMFFLQCNLKKTKEKTAKEEKKNNWNSFFFFSTGPKHCYKCHQYFYSYELNKMQTHQHTQKETYLHTKTYNSIFTHILAKQFFNFTEKIYTWNHINHIDGGAMVFPNRMWSIKSKRKQMIAISLSNLFIGILEEEEEKNTRNCVWTSTRMWKKKC